MAQFIRYNDLSEQRRRRDGEVRYAEIVSENSDASYDVKLINSNQTVRATPNNPQQHFVTGQRVIVSNLSASRLVVGGGWVIISSAPQEQRGLTGLARTTTLLQSSAVVISVDPSPIVIEQGGTATATIYGTGLTLAPSSYESALITDNTAPVITATEVDIDLAADASTPVGLYDLTIHGVTIPDAIQVTELTFVTLAAVGASSALSTSSDPVSGWTARTPPETGKQLLGLTFGNNLYVAAVNTSTTNQIWYSANGGITWVAIPAAANQIWFDVAYGNSMFVAGSLDGTSRVQTSPDGDSNWSLAASAPWSVRSVAYDPVIGKWVAAHYGGPGTQMFSYAADPSGTWTLATAHASLASLSQVRASGLGTFIATIATGATYPAIVRSTDGVVWAGVTTARDNEQYLDVAFSATLGRWVAVSNTDFSADGKQAMYSDDDGLTWTAVVTPAGQWRSIAWSPLLTLFVAVGQAAGTNRCMTSPDGLTWTARTLTGDFLGIAASA